MKKIILSIILFCILWVVNSYATFSEGDTKYIWDTEYSLKYVNNTTLEMYKNDVLYHTYNLPTSISWNIYSFYISSLDYTGQRSILSYQHSTNSNWSNNILNIWSSYWRRASVSSEFYNDWTTHYFQMTSNADLPVIWNPSTYPSSATPTWTYYDTNSNNYFVIAWWNVYSLFDESQNQNLSCETYNISESLYQNYTEDITFEDYNAFEDFYYISNNSWDSVIWLWEVENVQNFLTWALQESESFSFNWSNNFFGIGEKPFMYLYDTKGIQKIRITWENFNIANIELYDMQGNFSREIDGENIENWIFLYWQYLSAKINFSKTLANIIIDDIEFWGENIVQIEKEYCEDLDTGETTLDWEDFSWILDGLETEIQSTEEIEFSFSSSWYTFLPNWFILNNFIPNPTWWDLIFEIIKPSWEKVYTDSTKNYWFDVATKITTFYHNEIWDYKVRIIYKYQSQEIFPTWDSYNNYTISQPEISWISENQKLEWKTCSNFFDCTKQTFNDVFWKIFDVVRSVWWLFNAFWNIWNTDEQKSLNQVSNFSLFSFIIPQASAEYDSSIDPLLILWNQNLSDIPLLNNIYKLIIYAALWGLIFLYILDYKKKKDD